MRYVLISEDKTPRVYHMKSCADMYQRIYGGSVIEVFVGETT